MERNVERIITENKDLSKKGIEKFVTNLFPLLKQNYLEKLLIDNKLSEPIKIESEKDVILDILYQYKGTKKKYDDYINLIDEIGLRTDSLYAMIQLKDKSKEKDIVKSEETRYHLRIIKTHMNILAKYYKNAADTLFSTTSLTGDELFRDYGKDETNNQKRIEFYHKLNKWYVGLITKMIDKLSQEKYKKINNMFFELKKIYPGISKKYFLPKMDVYLERSLKGLVNIVIK